MPGRRPIRGAELMGNPPPWNWILGAPGNRWKGGRSGVVRVFSVHKKRPAPVLGSDLGQVYKILWERPHSSRPHPFRKPVARTNTHKGDRLKLGPIQPDGTFTVYGPTTTGPTGRRPVVRFTLDPQKHALLKARAQDAGVTVVSMARRLMLVGMGFDDE